MSQETTPNKDKRESLHHARRKFLKQSSALTALALAPPGLTKAAGNNLDEKAAAYFEQQSLQVEINGVQHELSV